MADAPTPPLPVPGMPPPALADGELVARSWIAALVATTPLEDVAALPVAALAREAPRVCASLARALGSDDELALLGVTVPGTGALAGGRTPQDRAAALGRLRDALFEAVLGEADRPDGAWVARLAARVAHVFDRLLDAALAGEATPPEAPAASPAPARRPAGRRTPAPPLPSHDEIARLIAEVEGGEEAAEEAPDRAMPDPLAALDPARLQVREGAPPWERMIARAVGRHLEDGVPFAVLAVEADGAERLLAAEGGGQALERADRALGETVRARDRVVSDPPARWWALVPDAGVEEARALARRVAAAVGAIEHGGAPLRVSIGMASCPRDGSSAEALVAAADERLLGARASGASPDAPA